MEPTNPHPNPRLKIDEKEIDSFDLWGRIAPISKPVAGNMKSTSFHPIVACRNSESALTRLVSGSARNTGDGRLEGREAV